MTKRYFSMGIALLAIVFFSLAISAQNRDRHWARHFKIPGKSGSVMDMAGDTGLGVSNNGSNQPRVLRVKWHQGKLYMAGAWETGVDGLDLKKRKGNNYWLLWSWSPIDGWEVYCEWRGGALDNRGADGKIYDFTFLPDGRLVVAGAFDRLGNPGGVEYRRCNGVGIYNPHEPTANKWTPLGGTWQLNGDIYGAGVRCLEYDPQGNDLYFGGGFGGFSNSSKIHRFDLDTNVYHPMPPGVQGVKAYVSKILADTSTTPSTIYVGGKFFYTGGDGRLPQSGGTAKYSTSFASYQEGKGWKTYPSHYVVDTGTKRKGRGILSTAPGYIHGWVVVLDMLKDKNGDIWIVGAFSQGVGSGENLRGIAKWDTKKEKWVDPTGKGGVGREVFNIAQADNGKIYFSGCFGGRGPGGRFFPGFVNGEEAHMAISYDPASNKWEQLGEGGLSSTSMPECRMAVAGNNVYYVGNFLYFNKDKHSRRRDRKLTQWESGGIARWNEDIDFTTAPIITGNKTDSSITIKVKGGKGPFTFALNEKRPQKSGTFSGLAPGYYKITVSNGRNFSDVIGVTIDKPLPKEAAIGAGQNHHWSRQFAEVNAHHKGRMGANTGLSGRTLTQSTGLEWYKGRLYFCGNYDTHKRWVVWYWDPKKGWDAIARIGRDGWKGPPKGMKWYKDKLYVWGALSPFSGLAVYDPKTKKWSTFTGTYKGKTIYGCGSSNRAGVVTEVKWDAQGNMYMVGNFAADNRIFPLMAAAFKVDTKGEYHPMGKPLYPYAPGKAKTFSCIELNESVSPPEIFVGGTFRYYGGPPTHQSRMAYNIVKWDYKVKDWRPIGKGITLGMSPLTKQYYPEGLHGLPSTPGGSFLTNAGWPIVRDLIFDKKGNLYVAGSICLIDETKISSDQNSHYGIVKYDRALGRFVGVSKAGGVSRSIAQMSWLNEETLLLSGSFNYANDLSYLGNVAKLNVKTGKLSPLGGGLRRANLSQLFGAEVRHAIKGDDLYFFGFFNHAGVNKNSRVEAPNSSNFIARWNEKKDFDPNRNLRTKQKITVITTAKYGSKNHRVTFVATGAKSGEKVTWYRFRSNRYRKVGSGAKFTENIRARANQVEKRFVSITNAQGIEGGKLPVTVKFVRRK